MKFWRPIPVMLIALALSSCKDSLTIKPDNKTVINGYYDSAQKIEQAVIGGYVDLRRALVANYAWLMYGEARVGDMQVTIDYQQTVLDQKLTSDNRFVRQLTDWGYFYDVIKDANDLLDIVNSSNVLTNYQRNLYRGEALALKSTAYFYLARIWGSVPSAEKGNKGKLLTNAEAVALASTFATQAKGILPWMLLNDDGIESAAITNVRFNKTAITTLLAQQQLWLGKMQEAYTNLTGTFNTIATDSVSSFSISLGVDRRTDLPATPLGAAVVSLSIDRLNVIYPPGDTRRVSMFNINTTQNKATLIVKDASTLELLPQREINLLLAEAAWRTTRLDEAKTYLTRAAAGATENYSTLTDATFADALLKERRRMLMGTGQRVFDLIRFGKVPAFIPAFSEEDVQKGAAYWPLSANSISGNSLSQNTYWLSKK